MTGYLLRDVEIYEELIDVDVVMESDHIGMIIHPKGYETREAECGPILLERVNGRLRLLVWADINESDPTHVIDLEGARRELLQD